MKTISVSALIFLASLLLSGTSARADLEISAGVQIHAKAEFDVPLAPYGAWVTVGLYGRCWRPAGVAVEWRPYCSGEWVWTDCGWYWQSDEPWGWACYHYGSWVFDPAFGWVWVPGVEWAPAWVSWRVGGGFIGWAPLGPPGWFHASAPAVEHFVFVSTGRFVEPIRATVVVKDTKVFSRTSAIGGVKRQNMNLTGAGSQHLMFNEGPGAEMIQKGTGKSLRVTPIGDAVRRTQAPGVKSGGSAAKPDRHEQSARPTPDQGHGNGDDFSGGYRGNNGRSDSWSPGSGNGRGKGGGGHGKGK